MFWIISALVITVTMKFENYSLRYFNNLYFYSRICIKYFRSLAPISGASAILSVPNTVGLQ